MLHEYPKQKETIMTMYLRTEADYYVCEISVTNKSMRKEFFFRRYTKEHQRQ